MASPCMQTRHMYIGMILQCIIKSPCICLIISRTVGRHGSVLCKHKTAPKPQIALYDYHVLNWEISGFMRMWLASHSYTHLLGNTQHILEFIHIFTSQVYFLIKPLTQTHSWTTSATCMLSSTTILNQNLMNKYLFVLSVLSFIKVWIQYVCFKKQQPFSMCASDKSSMSLQSQ